MRHGPDRQVPRASLQVVPGPGRTWQVVGEDGREPSLGYARRDDAETAAERALRRQGGGKIFVFDAKGRLVSVSRIAGE